MVCSLFPIEIHSDGNNFADLAGYLAENEGNETAENDAEHSNHIFDLVFKETAEKKNSSTDTNGIPALKQGIHLIEVASVIFSSDRSLLYKGLKLLANEYCSDLVNRSSPHFFSYLLSLTGDIAINAP